ncbi:ABC transporter G family member 20 [Macrosteles quadrilineatus]|uniref:ABC transporter G family member 20 n=1 Tax=Macrosteles quadrilineatus TaxID=74068 RepID=UPI0023E0BD1B|nr:ABC transporter G family member 20 [Macrosteles quadrilineatus]
MDPPVDKRRTLVTQQSTVWARRQHAVCVRRAKKRYGPKDNPNVILDNLNMTVPKGTIYGLLGASGCGKTTLLSCIVGRRTLNSGEIWVLGGKPGSKGSGVPGPRVGYMPQEIALYGEFTIRETMMYFGWVSGMTTKEVDEKLDFLINLLQLPPHSRAVKNLSGGQQRRVSLAAVLLHEPELLILDEPTVGVDPLLRQNIWDHLVTITRGGTTTVIITTHYIDETRQAGLIGLMRGGRFLAEESPADLLQKHNCDSLENVFLKLSIIQNKGKRRRSSILMEVTAAATAAMPDIESGHVNEAFDNSSEISGEFGDNVSLSSRVPVATDPVDPLPPDEEVDWSMLDLCSVYKSHHMKALIWKNALWMIRNVGIMLFIIGLPVMQIILFCLSIGKDPRGLPLAIVNHELNKTFPHCSQISSLDFISCQYLKQLERRSLKLKYFDNYEDAELSVHAGKAWGVLEFPEEYSTKLQLRLLSTTSANESVIEGSEIFVGLDMSNQQIAYMLRRDLYAAYEEMGKVYAVHMGLNPDLLKIPIRFNNPVYGPPVPNFTDFAAPGVMLTIIFFLAVALTSGAMLIERNEGIMERGLVSGITGVEILTAHVITQFLVMLGQSVMVVVFALFVFDVTNHGEVILVLVLVVLDGMCGMTYGFVVSCVTDSERNATYLALGSFLPFVMLCGVIWPVQGMHKILRNISYFLPLTLSTESLRSILAKGWSINETAVYAGYISMSTWIMIFMVSSVLLIKFKKG